ncbi:hypothetical protein AALH30_03535 [Blautia pseudococcoides]|uniref:hypothetical protein n=1 Tax=Blautia pseudococcoides TaxID=1796616 RepID=UPI00148B2943|nr:hypothetical protein [Blautia pseudococcoides]QJU13849.1 hypothetical protein HL650_04815 [Blautia pseudococcoides]
MKLYKYGEYTIAQEERSDEVIIAEGQNFYKVDHKTMNELFDRNKLEYITTKKDNPIFAIAMTVVICITIFLYFSSQKYVLVNTDFLQATMILIFNIVIHEAGHIVFLKGFYRKSIVKVGFKFVFIYPAFFVDTSYSYLLPKYKRIAIYLAGNFMNCVFLLLCIFFFPHLLPYCYLIVSNILINFIPIIKSDGYYAFIALINKVNKSLTFKGEMVEDFIRGSIMFAFMSVLSYVSNFIL